MIWQSIETAPRDGTPILLGEYDEFGEVWVSSGRWKDHGGPPEISRWFDGEGWLSTPTHWQPALNPPNRADVEREAAGEQVDRIGEQGRTA